MWTHYPISCSSVNCFLCNNQMSLICACKDICKGKKTLYVGQAFHHHIHSCPEQSVHVNRPSHLCLLQSTWPQSDSLLESSVCADWQWAQPGQRPESSGASWPSHTMWSWLITQNRCPLKQQRRTALWHLDHKMIFSHKETIFSLLWSCLHTAQLLLQTQLGKQLM